MLSEIKESYESYKEIYKHILPIQNENDKQNKATQLLENSLYLSVFTIFENFLKNIINNYVENICVKGKKFTDVSEGIARKIFMSQEKRIRNILDSKSEENNMKSFESYFRKLKSNLSKEDIQTHIHFEYLHENKLNGYYRELFYEILGDNDFLMNIKLIQKEEHFEELNQEIHTDALHFISEYTEKIRNQIAHENDRFKIAEFSNFERSVDNFYQIILSISRKYEENTGFVLAKKLDQNVLDDFDSNN